MSRARSITYNGEKYWYDSQKGNRTATVDQLELLAAVDDLEVDDLLDEGLTQAQVIERLRKVLGQGVIPAEVLDRQRQRREQAQKQRECRVHPGNVGCEGRITRHHFITNWLMKELENYDSYSRRDRCTIPLCMGFHRDLHMRRASDKSIVPYLNDRERAFAQKMLEELDAQHPKITALMRKGDPEVSYEAQLIKDFDDDKFIHENYGDIRDDIPFMGEEAGAFVRRTIQDYDPEIKLPRVL